MSKVVPIARLAFALLLAVASSAVAIGEEAGRTRVTIRGSGSNVAIEQTQAPSRRPIFESEAAPDPLADAIHLKTEGLDDGQLLAYLRAHETELPSVIGARTMARLRRAGAGKSVTAYLATVAAVDIGETGEGRQAVLLNGSVPETGPGTPAYDMPYGYPIAGWYGAPGFGRRHGFGFSHRRGPFVSARPYRRGVSAVRPMFGRRPIR